MLFVLHTHRYAKVTGNSITWFKRKQLNSVLHRASGVVHELIVMLSSCWTAFKANGTAPADNWTPPESFSRKTTKYWVAPADISRLKVFVLKHLPILEMNQSRKVSRAATCELGPLPCNACSSFFYFKRVV